MGPDTRHLPAAAIVPMFLTSGNNELFADGANGSTVEKGGVPHRRLGAQLHRGLLFQVVPEKRWQGMLKAVLIFNNGARRASAST